MFARGLGACAALLVAVALMSASSPAVAGAQGAVDVSTRAAVVHYLRSIHIDPRGVVIERGVRNYAGAACPGRGWTCTTTTHPVVQVASAGGSNTFRCSTARCAVVQFASPQGIGTNVAMCIKTTGVAQACKISQVSATANNEAVVYENAVITKGSTTSTTTTLSITQAATSSVVILQNATAPANAANSNEACVYQAISLDRSGTFKKASVTLTQAAHQTVTIRQNSSYGGNSAAESATPEGQCTGSSITQRQTVSSTMTVPQLVKQKQNAAKLGPNLKLDIEQNQAAGFFGSALGHNAANFTQYNSLTAVANSPAGPVRQTQSSSTGGLLGTVNQDSRDPSTISTTQTEIECEDAAVSGLTACHTSDGDAGEGPPSLTQTQFGPIHPFAVRKGVGVSTQTGNAADTFAVSQSTIQDNDQGVGSHQTNNDEGDCSTDGNCTVTQQATIDGQQTTNVKSGQDVVTNTTCTGSSCTSNSGSLLLQGVDVREFGQGGMRGTGTGTVAVTGIKGPVTRALLWWNGPTNSSDPDSNASVTFNGTPITGHNIGTSSPNCWPFTNSQSYRADVTHLVTGNGTYSLANFIKSDGVADINGVALFVFYNDGDSTNDRNVVLWNGNDSNVAYGNDPADWDETISGVPYPGSGAASLNLVVGDGQTFDDGELDVNGSTLAAAGPIFQGDLGPSVANGSLWDIKSFSISGLLSQGSNNLHITSPIQGDCLSLVVAAANVPVHSSGG